MLFNKNDKILIFAGGGGGDIASAGYLYMKLSKYVNRVYISGFPWERYIIDPIPGPINASHLRNVDKLGEYSYIAYRDSYAERGGKKIIFQAASLANILRTPIYLVTGEYGVEGLYKGIKEIYEYVNVDYIIGLDVGGDILAVGYEDELWSPLADQMTLAALFRLELDGIKTMIAISSPGSDGELNREYILERIMKILSRKGFYGILGYGVDDLNNISKILDHIYTEASEAVKHALQGFRGEYSIREGTRKIFIDWISTLVFFLDTKIVYSESIMAKEIINTSSIEEANKILLKLGVPTEYELERELSKYVKDLEQYNRKAIYDAWYRVKKRAQKV